MPRAHPASAWLPLLPVLLGCAIVMLFVARFYSYPSAFDELGHVSVVAAQASAPDLFADTRTYRLLDSADPARWTEAANYINHPALYYLLLAPISGDVTALRIANVALSLLAIALISAAGLRLFATMGERVLFAVVAAAFPKTLLIGGMVNNDNLAMVAAAMVLAGLCGAPGAALLVAGGLALAGWSKLTALIALAAAVAALALLDGQKGLWRRDTPLALAGLAVGALPYLVSLVKTGKLFHVNAQVFASAPGMKPDWSFADYAREFFTAFAVKWPAAEASLPLWLCVALIALPMALALLGAASDTRVRRVGIAYLAATAVTLVLHFGFGWRSFEAIGDLTIAQTRYYNVLWPGLALAMTAGLMQLGRLRIPALIALLIPTVPGGIALAAIG